MFFDRLSEACSMHGTSPSAVAIQIGRSKSNVTGWKKGQIPSSDTVTAIADVLQVPTDFLLERHLTAGSLLTKIERAFCITLTSCQKP